MSRLPLKKEKGLCINVNGHCKKSLKEPYKRNTFHAFNYDFKKKLFAFPLGILSKMHRSVTQIVQKPSEDLLLFFFFLYNVSGEGPVKAVSRGRGCSIM